MSRHSRPRPTEEKAASAKEKHGGHIRAGTSSATAATPRTEADDREGQSQRQSDRDHADRVREIMTEAWLQLTGIVAAPQLSWCEAGRSLGGRDWAGLQHERRARNKSGGNGPRRSRLGRRLLLAAAACVGCCESRCPCIPFGPRVRAEAPDERASSAKKRATFAKRAVRIPTGCADWTAADRWARGSHRDSVCVRRVCWPQDESCAQPQEDDAVDAGQTLRVRAL